jgi:hypothetical protein
MIILKVVIIIISIYFIFLSISIPFAFYKRKSIRELFIKTVNFLNQNNIIYWVDFGTLLGIHRDKDIILGDNDADICVPFNQEKKLLNALEKSGNYFQKWERMNWPAFRTYNLFFYTDLYLVENDDDNKMVRIPDSGDTPLNLLSSFETVNMSVGNQIVTFRQPTEWKNLLIFRYGKKWNETTNKWYSGYLPILESKKPRN